MRDIRFRGYNKKNGRWLYGNLIKSNVCCDGEYYIMSPNEDSLGVSDDLLVEKDSIGQSLLALDRNGVEIFEGDFVKELEGWREEFGQIAQVKFVAEDCAFMLVYPDGDYIPMGIERRFKVIGNIHDNPELAKGSE